MNWDDLVSMATEAGLWPAATEMFPEEIKRFACLVAAAEREACAQIAEIPNMAQSDIARAIRSR